MDAKIYKPCRSALVAALSHDAVLVIPAIVLLAVFRHHWWGPVLAVLPGLAGLYGVICTYNVMTTHVVVTDEHVGTISPRASLLVAWEDIAEVVLRERPRGIQWGRADRLVVLSDQQQRRAGLNTSVLTEQQEREVIDAIRQRVRCQIREVTDR